MVRVGFAVGVVLLIALLQGCATEPGRAIQALFAPAKGEPAFNTGIKQYDNGDYVDAMKSFQSAVSDGLRDSDRVSAHKHLAFIHCASGRERQCRDEFRRALAVDSGMELTPAEAGHPVWGPIFRSLKAGR
jgi:Tfp pilus assembly protein PilF